MERPSPARPPSLSSRERILGASLYAYVWRTSRQDQVRIIILVSLVTLLSVAPLELQRRIVENAVSHRDFWLIALLGLAYLVVLLLQGSLKYALNVVKGRVLEVVSRDLRKRLLRRKFAAPGANAGRVEDAIDPGTAVSILSAESEDVGEFASSSLSTPLLQGGTILWVMAYLIWVEPKIALLALLVYMPQAFLVPRIQRNINRLARRRTRILRKLGHKAAVYENLAANDRGAIPAGAAVLVELIFKLRMIIYRQKYLLTFLGNFLDSFGVLVVLLVGGYLLIHDRTTISTLVVFISGFQKISDPWSELIGYYRSVSNARVTYGLVEKAIDAA